MTEAHTAPDPAQRPLRNADGGIDPALIDRIARALEAEDAAALRGLVADMHEADLGAVLETLEQEARLALIRLLGADFDFAALTEVDDSVREDILEALPAQTVAEGVRELDTDDAVYILEDLDEANKRDVLERLPPGERIALQQGLDYPEGSAGRRMQAEYLAIPPFWTVGQTIDHLRDAADLPERFYEIFVADPGHRFVGSVQLDRLLRTRRPVELAEITSEDSYVVNARDDIEEVARAFQRYNLVTAPVIDDAGRLVGVLTIDDIVDVIEDAADDDAKQLGGVDADEELSDPVPQVALSRFRWRLLSLVASFLSASVMALFEDQLAKLVALAVLAPIVAGQGGNAATQTMTVAVRALATRELGSWNLKRFFKREIIVGLLNGCAFALITGLLAWLWFGSAMLSLVIAIAMVVTQLSAALAGAAVPVLLDRMRIDPAISSGTFVTTVTDVIGFFSFLGFATIILRIG